MKPTLMITTTLLASLASQASGQTPSDAGCLLVSNVFAKQSKDPAQKELAQSVLFFYFGRIDARLSAAQLKTALQQEGKTITAENASALMNSCARNMEAKQQALQNVSQQLQQGK